MKGELFFIIIFGFKEIDNTGLISMHINVKSLFCQAQSQLQLQLDLASLIISSLPATHPE
jgi:hypothetical protein